MFRKAYAKINWLLRVTGTDARGYHLLEMLMQQVSLCDDVYCEEADDISVSVSGLDAPETRDNLVWKAAERMKAECGVSGGAAFRLIKRIPSGAGLGGGSADCAAALEMLRDMWEPDMPDSRLMDIGASLGADVPYCLYGRPACVRGFGEKISPADMPEGLPLVILKRTPGVSTKRIFELCDSYILPKSENTLDTAAKALSNCMWEEFGRLTANDLYLPACDIEPGISADRQALLDSGALFAAMTGSGSAVFGVFESVEKTRSAADHLGGTACTTL